MDFRLGAEVEAFRDEVRAFLAEHVTDEVIERAHDTGTMHDWGLHRAWPPQGWISAGWPAEYGGQGRVTARDERAHARRCTCRARRSTGSAWPRSWPTRCCIVGTDVAEGRRSSPPSSPAR